MKIVDYVKTRLVYKLTLLIGGIFFLAGVAWAALLVFAGAPAAVLPAMSAGGIVVLSAAFMVTGVVLNHFLASPLMQVSEAARAVSGEKFINQPPVFRSDEIGRLSRLVFDMSDLLAAKQQALEQEHSEYQSLFETVPCLITIQDRDLRLIRYNREFAEKFDPRKGDYCYSVYKGRSEKCDHCPVEKTFQDGKSHSFEEAGYNREGKPIRWVARTAPIRDENGHVVAAMEMSLDVTLKRELQEKLEASQRRYQAIFSNIPNPVFVLEPSTMMIMDCNDSVEPVYGYTQKHLKGKSFLDFFEKKERDMYSRKIQTKAFLHQVRQFDNNGNTLFVDIRASKIVYPEWEALLVTTSDITQQLETEQQLIQASKMTTLGEMATGIAHELNQPLSVMKTASSFMLRKFDSGGAVNSESMGELLRKIDSNVDRASNIIGHMRQFARKSGMDLENVDVNHVLQMASEIFSEQLKIRGIHVKWETGEDLPLIRANPSRLEQVFINILINARDAIEERWGDKRVDPEDKTISIVTHAEKDAVVVEICDTGNGISEGIMSRIFEPFYTTKSVGDGTGLGLSISYSIVKECGGVIQVSNRHAGGACFTMRFPKSEEG